MFVNAAVNDIDQKAGEVRATYITVAPGQEAAYLLKADEARRFLADPEPDESSYPMLSMESGAMGQDISELARVILQKADEWQYISGVIESRRLYWKDKIRSADNYDAVYMSYMTGMRELESIKCA